MNFLWPGLLLLLGLVPLIIAIYAWMLRRRGRFAVRYSSLALVREELPKYSRLRRHLHFALFLLALVSLVFAISRPVASLPAPASSSTIILAIDVSRSMCTTDIPPNRLEAAKKAALTFIKDWEYKAQIGVVAFAGFAAIIQPPTQDQEVLQDAIESLNTGRRTAIGSAILKSIDAIAELDKSIAPSQNGPSSGATPTPVPEGTYAPAIIILLTDGASNSGPAPQNAAQQARDRGVRVYTIGFGTANENAAMPNCDQHFQSGSQNDPPQFFGGGWNFRRGIDEETLRQVADMTGADYYSAQSASDLEKVFQGLPINFTTRQEMTEVSVLFTGLGAILALLAITLSLAWHTLP